MTIPTEPELTIISATRHEADNVGPLVERISTALADDLVFEIVFVDDSDDGTPRAIRRLVDAGYPVRLLHRPRGHRPGGLSGALCLGFEHASAPLSAVIDADLQHPPELLASLVAPIRAGHADMAVASRYVAGGSSSGLDGPYRHALSRGAVVVVQTFFPRLRSVRDPASGYFALRRDLIDATPLRPEGFKMLVELLVRVDWDTVVEVPFHFAGRASGQSKAGLKLGLYFLRHIYRLWNETSAPVWMQRFARPNPAHASGPVLTEAHPDFADPAAS